jgi:hypothetical protein
MENSEKGLSTALFDMKVPSRSYGRPMLGALVFGSAPKSQFNFPFLIWTHAEHILPINDSD